MRMICKDASIEYGWGPSFNPFYGFKKPTEDDPYDEIKPFSIEEQRLIIDNLAEHWKPYFQFAFSSGLRQGEQFGLKAGDIDWENETVRISRAITRDENGRIMEGKTKNRYSRRTIPLLPVMKDALLKQLEIHKRLRSEYLFCTKNGFRIRSSNLRKQVWIPVLKKAGIDYRDMKQTRHSFATNALSCGENPLWIAKVMGHRNTDMIIKVYGKYINNNAMNNDGNRLSELYRENLGM